MAHASWSVWRCLSPNIWVLGDAVNLAARLMQAAEPGQILANDEFHNKARAFRWEDLPAIRVKGKRSLSRCISLSTRGQRTGFSFDARFRCRLLAYRNHFRFEIATR
jgi:class 3 adenylate cyclase